MILDPQRRHMAPVLGRQEIRNFAERWGLKLTPGSYSRIEGQVKQKEIQSFLELKERGFFGISTILKYFNANFHESAFEDTSVDYTYMGAEYWHLKLRKGEKVYRLLSEDSLLHGYLGPWWVRASGRPLSQIQAMIDGAVFSEWNSFQVLAELTIPIDGVLGYEGAVAPQFIQQRNPTKEMKARKYGSIYLGQGNQMLITPDQQKAVLESLCGKGRKKSSKLLRLFLWDRLNPNGTLVPLEYQFDETGFHVDVATIKRHNRILWGKLRQMASLEKYSGCRIEGALK